MMCEVGATAAGGPENALANKKINPMKTWLKSLGVALLSCTMSALSNGCTEAGRPGLATTDAGVGLARPLCADQDGDGYGRGCELGPDCDDADTRVTIECRAATCEANPLSEGCPCEGNAVSDCGKVTQYYGDHVICGYGAQLCNDGMWTECRLVGVRPTRNLSALGAPAECLANPCDPDCKEFTTEPGYVLSANPDACNIEPSCQDGQQNQDETGIDCGGSCQRDCAVEATVLSSTFTSAGSFVFQSNLFRTPGTPNVASGTIAGGVATVNLGSDTAALDVSGGFSSDFSADAPATVHVEYTVHVDSAFAPTECVQVLLSVDGVLYGDGGSDAVFEMCGGGDHAGVFDVTTNLLTPGTHTLALGGYIAQNAGHSAAPLTLTFDNLRVTTFGVGQCGNGTCLGAETCANCATDCGDCPPTNYCGDGACGGGETCSNCATDCGGCPSACGNGLCTGVEACDTCATDCGACTTLLGNGVCDPGETCSNAALDCGACYCGDAVCGTGESCSNCAKDCGACALCGDGVCEGAESCTTCESDCGGCAPALSPGGEVYLEAECPFWSQNAYAPSAAVTDGSVVALVSVDNSTSEPTDGDMGRDWARYRFELTAGVYNVYFRVLIPTSPGMAYENDSWFWRISGATAGWVTENNWTGTAYHWISAGGGATYPLAAGVYELDLVNRENDVRIDRIAIVRSAEPAPSAEGAAADNCTGLFTCGNGTCDAGESCETCAADCGTCYCGDGSCGGGETCADCSSDCGDCTVPLCGNGSCTGDETCYTCAADCGACPRCGDDTCDAGEDCSSCAADCGACAVIERCGNGTCNASTEDCSSCAADCGACPFVQTCGNGTCETSEDCALCATDCGPCTAGLCGDDICNVTENCGSCPGDCGECYPMCAAIAAGCGDATCDASGGETCSNCATDCGECIASGACGDSTCDATEGEDCSTCTADCGACTPVRECGDGLCEPSIGESCSSCDTDCGVCTTTPNTVCGDSACSIYETCSSCAADCGACPASGTGEPFNGGIIATGNMNLSGDRIIVNGDITGQTLSIGNDSVINGSVNVKGNASFGWRDSVSGSLRVEGTLYSQGPISNATVEYPASVTLETPPVIAAYPGTTSVYLGPDQIGSIPPGAYANLSVESRTNMTFSTGVYHFNSVWISPDADLVFDVSAGPIEWRVKNNITLSSRIDYIFSGGANTQFGLFSEGDITLEPDGNFPSALYAPNGTVSVQSRVVVSGGIAAKDIYLAPDITIGVGSFNLGWGATSAAAPPPDPVCGDGECTPETGESCSGCSADCAACETLPSCGDGSCQAGSAESCSTCAADCGACPAFVGCGDSTCDSGETCTSCAADCGPCPPAGATEPLYETVSFQQDYDIRDQCRFDQAPLWANLSWDTVTPSDTRVEIYFSSADSEANLATAPETLVAVAASSAVNGGWLFGPPAEETTTTVGSQYLDAVHLVEELYRHNPFGRVRMQLVPSSDGLQYPQVAAMNVQASCEIVQ